MDSDPDTSRGFREALDEATEALRDTYPNEDVPEDVSTASELIDLLRESTNTELHRDITRMLGLLAEEYPERIGPSVQSLVNIADTTDGAVRRSALLALGHVAESEPERLTPSVSTFVQLLETDDSKVRQHVLWILSHIAESDPEAVEPAKPWIIDSVTHSDEVVQRHSIRTIGHIADTYPEDVSSVVPDLRKLLGSQNLYRTVGRTLVQCVPVAEDQVIEGLLEQVTDGPQIRREHASWALVPVAENHPSLLWSTWPELLSILEDDEDYQVQNNVAATLAAMATERPNSDLIDELLALFDHPDMFVRRYVCLAIGDVAVSSADERLVRTLDDVRQDDVQLVSEQAEQILAKVLAEYPDTMKYIDSDFRSHTDDTSAG